MIPDKRTTIAAAIYGLCEPVTMETRKGKQSVVWGNLTDDQKRPYITMAEYLQGQTFGVEPQQTDRAKLASFMEKALPAGIKTNTNDVVSVFLNISTVLS